MPDRREIIPGGWRVVVTGLVIAFLFLAILSTNLPNAVKLLCGAVP